MGRTLEYAIHCIFKHSTGILSIKEIFAKISRKYTQLLKEGKLDEKDREAFINISNKLSKELNNFKQIIYKLLKGDIDPSNLLVLCTVVSSFRITIENILKELITIYKKYNSPDDEIEKLIDEFLPLLGDLYKIEQDHIPEIYEYIYAYYKNLKKLTNNKE